MGYGRATRPCAACSRLFRLIGTQNEALRAYPPRIAALLLLSARLIVCRENSDQNSGLEKIRESVTGFLIAQYFNNATADGIF